MAPRSPLVLATRNPHKLREFERLLNPAGIELLPLPEDVVLPAEDGDTFAANAVPKARTAAAVTGLIAIADDSGIEAEALGGVPGVRSARYAGENATDQENLDRLLREVPVGSRLRYVCALVWVPPRASVQDEQLFFGYSHGRLTDRPRGGGGFGYDPAFVPESEWQNGAEGRTMAELSDQEKDAISHRGEAARALVRWLTDEAS
jgi:XTP/dITP diphosphohydrolase